MDNHFTEVHRPTLMQNMLDNMAAGEEIVWEGKADFRSYQWHKVGLFGLFLIPFLAAFSLFPIFTFTLGAPGMAEFIVLFVMNGIPCLSAIGFFIAKIMTVHQSWANTYYVITNMRVIIQSAGIRKREIKSSYFNDISGAFLYLDLWDRKFYGTGTIRFKFNNLNFMQSSSSESAANLNEIRHIKDVEIVFAKIQMKISETRNMLGNPHSQFQTTNGYPFVE